LHPIGSDQGAHQGAFFTVGDDVVVLLALLELDGLQDAHGRQLALLLVHRVQILPILVQQLLGIHLHELLHFERPIYFEELTLDDPFALLQEDLAEGFLLSNILLDSYRLDSLHQVEGELLLHHFVNLFTLHAAVVCSSQLGKAQQL